MSDHTHKHVTVPCADCGEPVVIDRPEHDECPETLTTGGSDYGDSVPVEEVDKILDQLRRRETMLRNEDEQAADMFRQCADQLELRIHQSTEGHK